VKQLTLRTYNDEQQTERNPMFGGALLITWYTGNAEQVGGADLKGVEHLCRIVRIYHCNLDNERIFKFEKNFSSKLTWLYCWFSFEKPLLVLSKRRNVKKGRFCFSPENSAELKPNAQSNI
jgi:hypothetical protein